MNTPLIYLVAGEASGDALGADLMRALAAQQPGARFAGIGGEAMQRMGLASLFPYSDLSIMGFMEVVPHIPALLRRLRETAIDIAEKQPSAIVTIDSPGFNFRLARALKNNPRTSAIPRIHYVAPSVWAYKPGRARKTALLFNALLTLLPFEPPYFEKEGLPATFVGHPVLWEKDKSDATAFRQRHNIPAEAQLLLILPGSRRGEIHYHLKLFLEAAGALPGFTPVILAGAQVKGLITAQAPADMKIVDISEKRDAFAAATMALTKSGTISLELAAAGVPMVVAHRGSPLSAWLIRRMILIKYASLVNIAVNRGIIPELLQERCNPRDIAQALAELAKPGAMELQRRQCAEALAALRGNNTQTPGSMAARTVLRVITTGAGNVS
jgi:lipid-A-disaccharide synthase